METQESVQAEPAQEEPLTLKDFPELVEDLNAIEDPEDRFIRASRLTAQARDALGVYGAGEEESLIDRRNQAIVVLHELYRYPKSRISSDLKLHRRMVGEALSSTGVNIQVLREVVQAGWMEAIRTLRVTYGWTPKRISRDCAVSEEAVKAVLLPAPRAVASSTLGEEDATAALRDEDRTVQAEAAAVLYARYGWSRERLQRTLETTRADAEKLLAEGAGVADLPEDEAVEQASRAWPDGVLTLYFWYGWKLTAVSRAFGTRTNDPRFREVLHPVLKAVLDLPEWTEEEALDVLKTEWEIKETRALWHDLSQYRKELGLEMLGGVYGEHQWKAADLARLGGITRTAVYQWKPEKNNAWKKRVRKRGVRV